MISTAPGNSGRDPWQKVLRRTRAVSAALALLGLCSWCSVAGAARNVYVTNAGDGTVSQYAIGAGGALSPLSPATVGSGSGPIGIAVTPNGRSVYVVNLGGPT